MNEIKEFSTTDIVLASTLCVHNYKMVRIDVTGSRGSFVFSNVSEDFLQDYDLGKVLVEPTLFNNSVKRLTTSVRRTAQKY